MLSENRALRGILMFLLLSGAACATASITTKNARKVEIDELFILIELYIVGFLFS